MGKGAEEGYRGRGMGGWGGREKLKRGTQSSSEGVMWLRRREKAQRGKERSEEE